MLMTNSGPPAVSTLPGILASTWTGLLGRVAQRRAYDDTWLLEFDFGQTARFRDAYTVSASVGDRGEARQGPWFDTVEVAGEVPTVARVEVPFWPDRWDFAGRGCRRDRGGRETCQARLT